MSMNASQADQFLRDVKHIQSCPALSLLQQEPQVIDNDAGLPDWKRVRQGKSIEYFWHVPSGKVSIKPPGQLYGSGDGQGGASEEIGSAMRNMTEQMRSYVIELATKAGKGLSKVDEESRMAIQAATLSQLADRIYAMFGGGAMDAANPWTVLCEAIVEEKRQLETIRNKSNNAGGGKETNDVENAIRDDNILGAAESPGYLELPAKDRDEDGSDSDHTKPSTQILKSNQCPDLSVISEGLPPGWQAIWDPESCAVYYGNLQTKVRDTQTCTFTRIFVFED